MAKPPVDFLTFFLMWAPLQGWKVPLLHVRICIWLEHCTEPERVLMVFRGAAKSTIYAVYKAWKLYKNRAHRSLVWSADGPTATMLTADTLNVLRNHPLCRGMIQGRPGKKQFWVFGARDARNASMRSVGVEGQATGARADDVDFDDIEVPGNIETPEARLKLRNRISESTHIAVPGAQKTFIGTPHTHDSIYPERIAGGATVLKIPLFEHAVRYTDTKKRTRYAYRHPVGKDGLYVMAGIHTGARLLREDVDYRFVNGEVVFSKPPGVVIDICSMCAWPERFTRKEIERRRKETRTLNAWDSQYHLEAKPLTEVRLDPEKILPYDVEPRIAMANKVVMLYLGKMRMVGVACRWDPSSGKLKSDASSVAVVYQDELGRRYWHRAVRLIGEVAEFDDDGKTITGGQVFQLCDLVEELHLPRVTVETNGIGKFAPSVLRAALKQRGLKCAVIEDDSQTNKNKRILEAFEPLLQSAYLWAHVSVLDGQDDKPSATFVQMRQWNPAIANQPDDDLDAAAGAITDTPERVHAVAGEQKIFSEGRRTVWAPQGAVHDITLEVDS